MDLEERIRIAKEDLADQSCGIVGYGLVTVIQMLEDIDKRLTEIERIISKPILVEKGKPIVVGREEAERIQKEALKRFSLNPKKFKTKR